MKSTAESNNNSLVVTGDVTAPVRVCQARAVSIMGTAYGEGFNKVAEFYILAKMGASRK